MLRISKSRIKWVVLSLSVLRRLAREVEPSMIPSVYHIAAKCSGRLLARPTEIRVANMPASGQIQPHSSARDGHRSWLTHFAKSGSGTGVGSARLRGAGYERPNPRLSPTLHLHYIKGHCCEPWKLKGVIRSQNSRLRVYVLDFKTSPSFPSWTSRVRARLPLQNQQLTKLPTRRPTAIPAIRDRDALAATGLDWDRRH